MDYERHKVDIRPRFLLWINNGLIREAFFETKELSATGLGVVFCGRKRAVETTTRRLEKRVLGLYERS